MPYRSVAGRMALLILGACICACAMGEIAVERYPVWDGLEEMVTQKMDGFIISAKATTDWRGFVDEGDRIRGELPGHSFSYVAEC